MFGLPTAFRLAPRRPRAIHGPGGQTRSRGRGRRQIERETRIGAISTRTGGRGFWPGLVTGLAIAAAAALALALGFPPLQQPEIDPASLVAPTGAPLIEGAPRLEAAPAVEPGAAGASSLVPRE
jgi:hypothetical protein